MTSIVTLLSIWGCSNEMVMATQDRAMSDSGYYGEESTDMGDYDGAREILNEVLGEGSEIQCDEARQMLERL